MRSLGRFGHAARHLVVAALLAGCAAPTAPVPPSVPPVPLLVLHGRDASVVAVDASSGRPLGRPIPISPAPRHVVLGPDGNSLLALSGLPGQRGQLTFVSRPV